VATVVRKASSTDRQKMRMFASASDSVSSKMSRSRNTEIHASGENFQTTSP
jgi:hypothetical protein